MDLTIEIDRDDNERWIAVVREIEGAVAYGSTLEEAAARAQAIALRVIADGLEEQGYGIPSLTIRFVAPGYP